MHYIVGIDFGTHYTKVAYRISDTDKTHLFKFHNDSYKFPTTIIMDTDNQWDIGFDELRNSLGSNEKLYKYFKIAYAQSDEVDLYNSVAELTGQEYKQYSADLLSIAYLHRLIVMIKAKINRSNNETRPKRGVFSKLRSSTNIISSNTFEWRIGVPTEYSSKNQEKRFVKFNLLLLIAKRMSDVLYTKLDDFNSLSFNSYSDATKEYLQTNQRLFKTKITKDIHNFFSSEGSRNVSIACMQKEGLRVIPETAAAINVMVSTNSILPGVYSSIDIGGGSTDITFFHVTKNINSDTNESNQEFSFLGSVSVNLGVNDLVSALSKYERSSTIDLRKKLYHSYEDQTSSYKNVFHAFYEALEGHLIYLYQNKIMYYNGRDNDIVRGAFALMLGGGALLPSGKIVSREKQFLVFNDGSEHNNERHIYLEIKPLHSVGFNQNTIPTFDSLGEEANTVMVAFGLTTDLKRVNKFWNFNTYNENQLRLVRREEVGNFPWQIQINYVYERLTNNSSKNTSINETKRNTRNKVIEAEIEKNGRCLRKAVEGENFPDIQRYFQCLLKNKYKITQKIPGNIVSNNVKISSKRKINTKSKLETDSISLETNSIFKKQIEKENKAFKNRDVSCFSAIIKFINKKNNTIKYHSNKNILRTSKLKMNDNELNNIIKHYKNGTYALLTFDKTQEMNVISITIPNYKIPKRKWRKR